MALTDFFTDAMVGAISLVVVAYITHVWGVRVQQSKSTKSAAEHKSSSSALEVTNLELRGELSEQRQLSLDLRDLNYKLTSENQAMRYEIERLREELHKVKGNVLGLEEEMFELRSKVND